MVIKNYTLLKMTHLEQLLEIETRRHKIKWTCFKRSNNYNNHGWYIVYLYRIDVFTSIAYFGGANARMH